MSQDKDMSRYGDIPKPEIIDKITIKLPKRINYNQLTLKKAVNGVFKRTVGFKQKEIKEIIRLFIALLGESLANGQGARFYDLGQFTVVRNPSKTITHPNKRTKHMISPIGFVKFRPCAEIRFRLKDFGDPNK